MPYSTTTSSSAKYADAVSTSLLLVRYRVPVVAPRVAVVAFIDPRAPSRSDGRGDVIEKILRGHRRAAMVGGLWQGSAPRAPPDVAGLVHDLDGCFTDTPTGSSDQAGELTFVDMDTFLATF